MAVSGTTRLYGLIGDPLHAARSPQLFNELFAEHRLDAVCIPLNVKAGDLRQFVTGVRTLRNLAALLVTMPHKTAMLELVDVLDPTSRQAKVINIIRCDANGNWTGATFDGLGCVLGMEWEGNNPQGRSVLLVGAGGAGRAIAFALAKAKVRELTIYDVNETAGRTLVEDLATETACDVRFGAPDPAGFDVVINATALGMQASDPLPIDVDRLEPRSAVIDVVLNPVPTPLCAAARARGCATQGGRAMHEGQAVFAARFLGIDYWPSERSRAPVGEISKLATALVMELRNREPTA
jgi:shikimate dehydrogenase